MSWDDDDLREPKQKTRRSILSIGSTAFTGLKNRLKYTGKKIVSDVNRRHKPHKSRNTPRSKHIKEIKTTKRVSKTRKSAKAISRGRTDVTERAVDDDMPKAKKGELLTKIFEHPTLTRGQKEVVNKLLTIHPVKMSLKQFAEITGFKPGTILIMFREIKDPFEELGFYIVKEKGAKDWFITVKELGDMARNIKEEPPETSEEGAREMSSGISPEDAPAKVAKDFVLEKYRGEFQNWIKGKAFNAEDYEPPSRKGRERTERGETSSQLFDVKEMFRDQIEMAQMMASLRMMQEFNRGGITPQQIIEGKKTGLDLEDLMKYMVLMKSMPGADTPENRVKEDEIDKLMKYSLTMQTLGKPDEAQKAEDRVMVLMQEQLKGQVATMQLMSEKDREMFNKMSEKDREFYERIRDTEKAAEKGSEQAQFAQQQQIEGLRTELQKQTVDNLQKQIQAIQTDLQSAKGKDEFGDLIGKIDKLKGYSDKAQALFKGETPKMTAIDLANLAKELGVGELLKSLPKTLQQAAANRPVVMQQPQAAPGMQPTSTWHICERCPPPYVPGKNIFTTNEALMKHITEQHVEREYPRASTPAPASTKPKAYIRGGVLYEHPPPVETSPLPLEQPGDTGETGFSLEGETTNPTTANQPTDAAVGAGSQGSSATAPGPVTRHRRKNPQSPK